MRLSDTRQLPQNSGKMALHPRAQPHRMSLDNAANLE